MHWANLAFQCVNFTPDIVLLSGSNAVRVLEVFGHLGRCQGLMHIVIEIRIIPDAITNIGMDKILKTNKARIKIEKHLETIEKHQGKNTWIIAQAKAGICPNSLEGSLGWRTRWQQYKGRNEVDSNLCNGIFDLSLLKQLTIDVNGDTTSSKWLLVVHNSQGVLEDARKIRLIKDKNSLEINAKWCSMIT